MKGIAIVILIIVISPILVQPFLEMNLVIVDKAKIDSAIRNSGRLAITTSINDENRANVISTIDKLSFVKKFSDSLKSALNLEIKGTLKEEYLEFKALDEKFNDFRVDFKWGEETKYDLNNNEFNRNTVEVVLESPYKFKTKYLKLLEDSILGISDFKLTANKTFIIKIEN